MIMQTQTREAALQTHAQRKLMTLTDIRNQLEARLEIASNKLRAFPVGPTGITPDSVKASPEWRAARRAVDTAFTELREVNARLVRDRKHP
jgi:hypothetical protein